jgi:uncharacterized membrane protein
MTEMLEDKLIDLRERVDALLAKQKAYRRKHIKAKQVKQQSTTEKMQIAAPLNLQQDQVKDREQNLTKQRRMGMKYLGIVVIIGIFFGALEMGGGLVKAIDLMSLIFVLGIAIGHALGANNGENVITRFGDGCVRGGWLGFLIGIALIAGSEFAAAMDFSSIMPAMAVALLTPLYGYFFKIITMQLD